VRLKSLAITQLARRERAKVMRSEYEAIKDFVDDHHLHFGCYPMEVETEKAVYNYAQYMSIIEREERGQKRSRQSIALKRPLTSH